MSHYTPLEIELLDFAGVGPSLQAMRLPKAQTGKHSPNDDFNLASKLIRAGNDHAKFARGIVVWLELKLQVGWMIEFETYRHGVECLSTSSAMHGELVGMEGPELAEKKQADLPDKVYTRIVMISYQALRSMYRARRNHRHPDWQIFCDFIETLPYFKQLIEAKV